MIVQNVQGVYQRNAKRYSHKVLTKRHTITALEYIDFSCKVESEDETCSKVDTWATALSWSSRSDLYRFAACSVIEAYPPTVFSSQTVLQDLES
jgi:hypothetical protein